MLPSLWRLVALEALRGDGQADPHEEADAALDRDGALQQRGAAHAAKVNARRDVEEHVADAAAHRLERGVADVDARREGVAEQRAREVDQRAAEQAGALVVVLAHGGGGLDVGKVVDHVDEPHGQDDREVGPEGTRAKGAEETPMQPGEHKGGQHRKRPAHRRRCRLPAARVAVAATHQVGHRSDRRRPESVVGAGNVFADHEPRVAEMLGDERQQPPHHHREYAAGHLEGELHAAAVEHQHQQHRDERRAGGGEDLHGEAHRDERERNAGDRREHCRAWDVATQHLDKRHSDELQSGEQHARGEARVVSLPRGVLVAHAVGDGGAVGRRHDQL